MEISEAPGDRSSIWELLAKADYSTSQCYHHVTSFLPNPKPYTVAGHATHTTHNKVSPLPPPFRASQQSHICRSKVHKYSGSRGQSSMYLRGHFRRTFWVSANGLILLLQWQQVVFQSSYFLPVTCVKFWQHLPRAQKPLRKDSLAFASFAYCASRSTQMSIHYVIGGQLYIFFSLTSR